MCLHNRFASLHRAPRYRDMWLSNLDFLQLFTKACTEPFPTRRCVTDTAYASATYSSTLQHYQFAQRRLSPSLPTPTVGTGLSMACLPTLVCGGILARRRPHWDTSRSATAGVMHRTITLTNNVRARAASLASYSRLPPLIGVGCAAPPASPGDCVSARVPK